MPRISSGVFFGKQVGLDKAKHHVLSINARQLRELDRNIGEAMWHTGRMAGKVEIS
jgi:hypothetical protein